MARRRRSCTAALALVAATAATALVAGPAAAAEAPSPRRCYLAAVHEVFLGRPASVYDLERWSDDGFLYDPARAMARSEPWLEAVVVAVFDAALDREPEAEGLAFWVGRLRSGARVATTHAAVYGSEEVWARSGRTADGFVADVFPRIMGRPPAPTDVAYWAGEVGRRGRGGVAKALLGSIENRRDRVAELYQAVLGRAPEPSGWEYWARRLATLDDVDLAVWLARSDEAHQQAQVGCAVPPEPHLGVATSESASDAVAPALSDDGRWLAFLSETSNVAPGGDAADGTLDLFLRDQTTREVVEVLDVDADIHAMDISGDGRHIVFATRATDLLPGEGTAVGDVFSWDRTTGVVTQVTDGDADPNGVVDPVSLAPTISADGRFVAFASYAEHVPDDPPGFDGFVWDRTTGGIERITDRIGSPPVISPDGSTVLHGSLEALAPGERPGHDDVFAWDRATGTTSYVGPGIPTGVAADGDVIASDDTGLLTLIDAQTGGVTTISRPDDGYAGEADIASDGATVAFTARGDGRFPSDPPGTPDVFVWERATGTVIRLTFGEGDATSPTTSGDGRHVAFLHRRPTPPERAAEVLLWDRRS